MSPTLLIVLCPGFLLIQRMLAQKEKPVLSAWPSSTVTQGEHVEIKCHSHFGSDTFWLHKENGALVPEIQDRMFQNSFILGPVTPAHAGTYRCSKGVVPSAFSDPLDIVITGLYGQPSLAAQPGPMVKSGGKVTLQCGSEIMFETFILILEREGISRGMLRLSGKPGEGASQASVTVDPMTPSNSGTYSCYGCHSHQPYEWSAPSHPLELVVTDLYKKPSLSAQVGSVVWPGENVTLSCSSESPFGLFYVVKDKETDGLRLPAAQGHNGRFQADFLLGPVTHGGTYRCYGMYSTFCHEWSTPSDPLHLCVTGNSSSSCPSPPEPGLRTNNSRLLQVTAGLSAAILLLAVFFFLIHRWCTAKKKKSRGEEADAATVDQELEADRAVNREVGTSSSLPLLTDPHSTFTSSQDPEMEACQRLTYTQLDHRNSARRKATFTSQSHRPLSSDTSTYVEMMRS